MFIKKTLGMIMHLSTLWLADKRAWLAYCNKMKNKKECDCSVNLLGKIPGKGKRYSHTRCTENQ